MEVAVITRHAIANYGSLLQAAATQNAIEALGHSCRIIDYVRPNEVCTQLHKCQLQQKPRWNRTPLRRRVYSTLRYTENVMAGRLFENARRQMLHLTEPFSTAQELTANGPKADVYMTGSDQVWGPMEDGTYDPVYRLAFAPQGTKKVAYAASFGRTELSKPLRGQFCRDLRQYTSITVREDSAIALLRRLYPGVSGPAHPAKKRTHRHRSRLVHGGAPASARGLRRCGKRHCRGLYPNRRRGLQLPIPKR